MTTLLSILIIFSPMFLIISLAIKIYDGGPVFYKQRRCSRDMKPFDILKFRSMIVDAEKDGVARLAKDGDSRITPVGKSIRMLRLDELPQLWNVIKGDLSLVGPRPCVSYELGDFDTLNKKYKKRNDPQRISCRHAQNCACFGW